MFITYLINKLFENIKRYNQSLHELKKTENSLKFQLKMISDQNK